MNDLQWELANTDEPRDQIADLPDGQWAEVGPDGSGWSCTILDLDDLSGEVIEIASALQNSEMSAKGYAEQWNQHEIDESKGHES